MRESCSNLLGLEGPARTGEGRSIGGNMERKPRVAAGYSPDAVQLLAVAILDQQRYHELCERLRQAGFEPDVNEAGKPLTQRWRIESESRNATVDFLIPATLESDEGGKLRNSDNECTLAAAPTTFRKAGPTPESTAGIVSWILG